MPPAARVGDTAYHKPCAAIFLPATAISTVRIGAPTVRIGG